MMVLTGRNATCMLVAWALTRPGMVLADEPRSAAEKPAKVASRLGMSEAVACTRVDGLDQFVPLPKASLTSEDKLKVYFKPLRYKVEPAKKGFRASFSEDGRIRRKGEKTPVSKEDKLLEYEAVFDSPNYQIFLVNTIGLKNLPPGDYEFDIVLHDALEEGSSATQTLSFTIIPLPVLDPSASKSEEPAEPEGSAGSKVADPPKPRAKAKGKSGRPRSPGD